MTQSNDDVACRIIAPRYSPSGYDAGGCRQSSEPSRAGHSLWVIPRRSGQTRSLAHYAREAESLGGPWGTVSQKAARFNARAAFCFSIVYFWLSEKSWP